MKWLRLLQELLEIEKDRRAFIVMKCLVHCLVLQLSSFHSLCKNQLFSRFDKCRSQTPVTSSMAVGAWECCKSKSNSLHFILSLHTLREISDTRQEKKKPFSWWMLCMWVHPEASEITRGERLLATCWLWALSAALFCFVFPDSL